MERPTTKARKAYLCRFIHPSVLGDNIDMDCPKWHRLGERCGCGHVGVPARFYVGGTQKQAEARYMEFLDSVTKAPSVTGRPRQYRNNAERQKAYRGRK